MKSGGAAGPRLDTMVRKALSEAWLVHQQCPSQREKPIPHGGRMDKSLALTSLAPLALRDSDLRCHPLPVSDVTKMSPSITYRMPGVVASFVFFSVWWCATRLSSCKGGADLLAATAPFPASLLLLWHATLSGPWLLSIFFLL